MSIEYLVQKDSREQQGWDFPKKSPCLGTEVCCLKTGDYSLKGFEDVFVIERKRSTGEIATNIFEDRFVRELERLNSGFRWAFVVCEFTLQDVLLFPHNSGIPKSRWARLRVTSNLILKKLAEFSLRYPNVHFVYAGQFGKEYASSLFKRVVEESSSNLSIPK